MLALVGLLSVVMVGFIGFALGRRWRSNSPIRWALAAAGLQLVLLNVLRRTVFDVPSEATAYVLYREGAISFNEAARITAADTRASLSSFALAGVATLALLLGTRAWLGKPDEATNSAEDDQLVGQTCTACNKRIVVATDGLRCERCKAPIHDACVAHHRAACGPEGYRG